MLLLNVLIFSWWIWKYQVKVFQGSFLLDKSIDSTKHMGDENIYSSLSNFLVPYMAMTCSWNFTDFCLLLESKLSSKFLNISKMATPVYRNNQKKRLKLCFDSSRQMRKIVSEIYVELEARYPCLPGRNHQYNHIKIWWWM